jgi:hypothetical protein
MLIRSTSYQQGYGTLWKKQPLEVAWRCGLLELITYSDRSLYHCTTLLLLYTSVVFALHYTKLYLNSIRLYILYIQTQTCIYCMSVSLRERHLDVWALAPYFIISKYFPPYICKWARD